MGPEGGGFGPKRRKRRAPDGGCGARHSSQDVSDGEANCTHMEIIDRRDAGADVNMQTGCRVELKPIKGACFNQVAASQRHAVLLPWKLA